MLRFILLSAQLFGRRGWRAAPGEEGIGRNRQISTIANEIQYVVMPAMKNLHTGCRSKSSNHFCIKTITKM